MMGLYRALKRGEVIGLAADRGIDVSTRKVEFFGAPASLPEGPVRLALRTGAALVPGSGLRLSDNSFLARIEPALELPNTGDREADVAAGMEMVVGCNGAHHLPATRTVAARQACLADGWAGWHPMST